MEKMEPTYTIRKGDEINSFLAAIMRELTEEQKRVLYQEIGKRIKINE